MILVSSFGQSDDNSTKVIITEQKVYDIPDKKIAEEILKTVDERWVKRQLKTCKSFAQLYEVSRFEDKMFFRYNKQTGISETIERQRLKNEKGLWDVERYDKKPYDKKLEELENYIWSSSIGDIFETTTEVYCCFSRGNFDNKSRRQKEI